LREEMAFLNDYFSLLKIRFEQAVQLHLHVNETWLDRYLIPPISLQILVENAIKHNEFSDALPLVITIEMHNDELVIHNLIRKKILRKTSSCIGLHNLGERYKLTTSKEIRVTEAAGDFTVSLPVLKIA
jgi:sensor histidine kinase YesM